MLRYLFPSGSDDNGLSVIFDSGEVLELDGHMLFSRQPRISPEGDMVANLLGRPHWAFGALYLLDVYAQTYRRMEIDGMPDSHVPFWVSWLDNSHLLVGTAWGDFHRGHNHADVYVYIVEEDRFFKLFESTRYTQVWSARVEGDRMVVEYAVAVCFGFRDNFYEERERVFPLSEIYTLIAARQAYVFEWDVQLGLCEWIDF